MPSLVDNGLPNPIDQSYLQWLVNEESSHQDKVRQYREYYDGDHDTQLTARQRAYLELKSDQEFNVNYCPIVVDTLAERLNVTGFSVTAQAASAGSTPNAPEDEAARYQAALLWQWWAANRMDAKQGIIHTAAARDGTTYALVAWDNERQIPVISHEPYCVDGVGAKLHVLDDGTPYMASKRWIEVAPGSAGQRRRMNLYYPERIEKYVSASEVADGNWQPYMVEGEAWPAPWLDNKGQPLGVPMFPFRNKDQGYQHGQSEIEDVVPIQNALNKTVIDLLATADSNAFRIMIKLGGADPNNMIVGPGGIMYDPAGPSADGGGVQVTAIEGAPLDQFLNLMDNITLMIARVSRTPLNAFQLGGGASRIAADTLKELEAGLIAKASKAAVTFGNAYEDMMGMCRKLHNTFGREGVGYRRLDDTLPISTQWAEFAPRDEVAHMAELKAKKELGIPLEVIWMEAGYTVDQIAAMKNTDEYKARLAGMQLAVTDNRTFDDADGEGTGEADAA